MQQLIVIVIPQEKTKYRTLCIKFYAFMMDDDGLKLETGDRMVRKYFTS